MGSFHKSSPSFPTLHTSTRTHLLSCPCSRLEQTHTSPASRASSSTSAQFCSPMASQASAAPPMCTPLAPLRPLPSTSPFPSPAAVTPRGRVLTSAASGSRDPKVSGTPSQNRPAGLSPERRTTQAAAAPSDGSLAWQVQRPVSDQPQGSVYSGPASPSPKRVTLRVLRSKYSRGEPITMVTAYDYPSAVHVDEAGIDILLVGDSVAMVVHGHDTTLPISMDEMLVHCRAAARGARRAFLVGDMPFGSYETGTRDAVISAMRMLKEGGMDAVKLEGGSPARVEAARAIVEAGIAVVGHVGLTPQAISVIGGFRPQAQVAEEALSVLTQAQALQKAGCFAIVLECVPAPIAAAVTAALDIPTIGIGAGSATSGQVLVYHDLLGMMSHPHHAKVTPKFCKQYAHVGGVIQTALQEYRDEVTSGAFPSARYSPYRIPEAELTVLVHELRQRGAYAAAQAAEEQYQSDQAAAGVVAPPVPVAAPVPTITSITNGGAPTLTVPTVTSITNGLGH